MPKLSQKDSNAQRKGAIRGFKKTVDMFLHIRSIISEEPCCVALKRDTVGDRDISRTNRKNFSYLCFRISGLGCHPNALVRFGFCRVQASLEKTQFITDYGYWTRIRRVQIALIRAAACTLGQMSNLRSQSPSPRVDSIARQNPGMSTRSSKPSNRRR